MQKQQPKSQHKISIPRYSDKYKDMMRKEEDKPEAPPSPRKTETPEKKTYFLYKVKTIGVGAHSFVSLVQEEETKMLLAEKAITREHAQKHMDELIQEIKILSLCDHENLTKLYHVTASETHISLLLEFAEDSLFALKQKFGLFKQKQAVEIVRQLLNGLHYLHTRGIVHADVKLQNIMISNGTIKLCDFGYAHRHQESTTNKEIVGTMEYLPPEYAQGVDSGCKRDIWAVGILVFEMLVGKNPFESLRQNEKWSKLIKNKPETYLDELLERQQELKVNSERIGSLLTHIFCPAETRWTAEQLLQLPLFSPK